MNATDLKANEEEFDSLENWKVCRVSNFPFTKRRRKVRAMKDFDALENHELSRDRGGHLWLWLARMRALFSLFAWLEPRLFEGNFEHGAWLLEILVEFLLYERVYDVTSDWKRLHCICDMRKRIHFQNYIVIYWFFDAFLKYFKLFSNLYNYIFIIHSKNIY